MFARSCLGLLLAMAAWVTAVEVQAKGSAIEPLPVVTQNPSAARAAQGENRVQSADDRVALGSLKNNLNIVLNELYTDITAIITGYDNQIDNTYWPKIKTLYYNVCTQRGGTPSGNTTDLNCTGYPVTLAGEVDPTVRAHIRTSTLGASASLPVCNPQTHDLRFSPASNQWLCHEVNLNCGSMTLWQ